MVGVGVLQGEIAAAFVAGVLSLDDAARVVALRALALRDGLAGRGGMVSVAVSEVGIAGRLEGLGGRVSLAAVNGPSAVVVSGEAAALEELVAGCEADGVRARWIPVDYAGHSAQVEAIGERLLSELSGITPRVPVVPFHSTVTGGLLDSGQLLDAEYWYRNLRGTVRFEQALRVCVRWSQRWLR